jgi:hypothetical protein
MDVDARIYVLQKKYINRGDFLLQNTTMANRVEPHLDDD